MEFSFALTISLKVHTTTPKIRFPTCSAYQKMTFSHIPTHIWQRIGQNFMKVNEMCKKMLPYPYTDFLQLRNSY